LPFFRAVYGRADDFLDDLKGGTHPIGIVMLKYWLFYAKFLLSTMAFAVRYDDGWQEDQHGDHEAALTRAYKASSELIEFLTGEGDASGLLQCLWSYAF
jgi:hypothetical protein